MATTLILGGARSGKSAIAQKAAEQAAAATNGRLVFIATAEALDAEMAERIARHRLDRGPAWTTIEAPVDLAGALRERQQSEIILVDCLTLWLSNLLMQDRDITASVEDLVATVQKTPNQIWMVSNEVGQGIVPDNTLARRFRDEAGRLHQRLAAVADRVFLVVAGLSLSLK